MAGLSPVANIVSLTGRDELFEAREKPASKYGIDRDDHSLSDANPGVS